MDMYRQAEALAASDPVSPGARLREIRQGKGMRLIDVAERAGVTKGFLSLAERGKTNVSVPVLMRICDALDVSPASLFEYPNAQVVRTGSATASQMGGVGVTDWLLTPEDERHLQVIHTQLIPRGGSGGGYRLDAASIFVYVLNGTLEIAIDGVGTTLGAGDCLTFGGTQAHDWHNPTDSDTDVLWVLTPPIPSGQLRRAMDGDRGNG
jgi:transcriptional regulator with XRE-family HTH domain